MATLAVSANAQALYAYSDPFGAVNEFNEAGARFQTGLPFGGLNLTPNTYSDISVVGDVLYALNTATNQIDSFDAAGNAVTAAFTGVFLNNFGGNTSNGPIYNGLSIVGDVAYGFVTANGLIDAFDVNGNRVDATSAFGNVNVAAGEFEAISILGDTLFLLDSDDGSVTSFQVGVGVVETPFSSTFLNNTGDNTPSNNLYNGLSVQSIPEPSSTALLGLGALALIVRRKR